MRNPPPIFTRLPARDGHALTRRERGEREHQRGRCVVHHKRIPLRRSTRPGAIHSGHIGCRAPGLQVVFQVRVVTGRSEHGLDCRFRERRSAQVRMEDHTGGVDHPPQRRHICSAKTRLRDLGEGLRGDRVLKRIILGEAATDLRNGRARRLNLDWLPSRVFGGVVSALDLNYVYFTAFEDFPENTPQLSADGRFVDVGIDALPNVRERFGLSNPNVDWHMDDVDTDGGPENDGFFQEGEPLAARGHRFDVRPRLAYPFRIADSLEVYPEVGYLESIYLNDGRSPSERGAITGRVDVRTRLMGRFKWPWLPPTRHILEPRLEWAYLRPRSQSDTPVYVPQSAVPGRLLRQMTLDNVVLDFSDRLSDFNILRLAFRNHFYAGGGSALRADVELSAAYDFDRMQMGLIALDGTTFPRRGLVTRFNLGYDPHENWIDQALMEVSFRLPPFWILGGGLSTGYRYNRDVPRFFEDFTGPDRYDEFQDMQTISQIDGSIRLTVGDRWAVRYRLSYSIDQRILIRNGASLEYRSRCDCWAIGLDLVADRAGGLRVAVRFNLMGLGDGNPFQGGAVLGASGSAF